MDDLISINDLSVSEIEEVFKKTRETKDSISDILNGKCLAMIFEKPSTRTRVSFENAMTQLGGHAIFLSPNDTQLGRGESIADTARVLSRYVDAIMARLFDHGNIVDLAKNAEIPVINGLTDFCHPCQILTDLYTVLEKKETLNLKFAWLGDGNNVCNSFIFAASKLKFQLSIATPRGFEPKALDDVNASNIEITYDPRKAVKDASVIITDTWVSMGQEEEKEKRLEIFKPFQVNQELIRFADPNYLFMHCLPAYRGYEVTTGVIDGPNSIVWDEAENRLHVQKAILTQLIH